MGKIINIIITVAVIAVVLASAGCEKTDIDTKYVIEPFAIIKAVDGKTDSLVQNPEDIVIYLFYVSEPNVETWAPGSYQNALDGKIYDLSGVEFEFSKRVEYTGEEIVFEYENKDGEKITETKKVISIENVNRQDFMLVACDRVNKIYGYKSAKLLQNMDQVWIKVIFKPLYADNESYLDPQKWMMVNEFLPEPPEPEEEGGEQTP